MQRLVANAGGGVSCGGWRMNEVATHLVDSVLPYQRIRQWVMSFPIPIRFILAVKPEVMGKALNIVNQFESISSIPFYGPNV